MTVLANPAWPVTGVEVDFTQGPPHTPGSSRVSINAGYRKLQTRAFAIDRGRQYELDQVQNGTLTLDCVDPLEYLNPDNSSSPFNTGLNVVTPYRCIQVWAMWPTQPTSGNINNTGVSSTYDPSFETSVGGWVRAGGTTTVATSTVQHFDATHALLVTQSSAGVGFGVVNSWPTGPGLTYTLSAYVYLAGAATVTLRLTDAAGVTHSASTSVTTTWTRLVVTWDCVDTLETAQIYSSTTTGFYIDAVALHFGSTAQTFGTTGPTLYALFTGYVERWPTLYDSAGFRALKPLVAVDALAIMAQTEISQSYVTEVLADVPGAYIPYDNTAAANSGNLIYGTKAIFVPFTFPSATGSVQWAGDQLPDGANAMVLQQNNAFNPSGRGHVIGTYPHEQQTTFDTQAVGGSLLNTGFTVECWARFSTGVALFMQLLQSLTGGYSNELGYGASASQHHLEMQTGAGRLGFRFTDASGFTTFLTPPGPVLNGYPDGEWHYYAITGWNNAGAPALAFTYDDVEFTVTPAASTVTYYGYTNLHHEASTDYGDQQTQISIARMAVYSRDITAARRQVHYQRCVGYLGEVSGTRVVRLLNTYWGGPQLVAGGSASLAPDHDYDTRALLEVLQEIQDTERGLVYARRDGTVVYESRTTRYLSTAAVATFGENTAGGELPYVDYASDHDPTYVYSQVNLTRPGNASYAPQSNATALARYGQRILTQDVKVTSDADLQEAAVFYLNRYAQPKTRVSKLTLDPSANPTLWPVTLGAEISQRVTVTRRGPALTTTGDHYLERISHRVDPGSGGWQVDLQTSPVFVPVSWVLGDSTYGVLGTTTVPIY